MVVDRPFVCFPALRPANPGQTVRASELSLPFLHCSRIVFGFPKDLDVRIDEIESGHHALNGNRLVRIVVRRAVVSKGHRRKRQKQYKHGNKSNSAIFHVVPYSFDSRFLAAFLTENTHRFSDDTYKTNHNTRLFQEIWNDLRIPGNGGSAE